MFAVTMLYPAYPRRDCHLVLLVRHRRILLIQLCYCPAHRLLDAFAHELLVAVELIAYIVKCASVIAVAVLCYREHLIIVFDGQF